MWTNALCIIMDAGLWTAHTRWLIVFHFSSVQGSPRKVENKVGFAEMQEWTVFTATVGLKSSRACELVFLAKSCRFCNIVQSDEPKIVANINLFGFFLPLTLVHKDFSAFWKVFNGVLSFFVSFFFLTPHCCKLNGLEVIVVLCCPCPSFLDLLLYYTALHVNIFGSML